MLCSDLPKAQGSPDKVICHEGDTWRVLSTGRIREDGKTYVHLASLTRFREQRNGPTPYQICDWLVL